RVQHRPGTGPEGAVVQEGDISVEWPQVTPGVGGGRRPGHGSPSWVSRPGSSTRAGRRSTEVLGRYGTLRGSLAFPEKAGSSWRRGLVRRSPCSVMEHAKMARNRRFGAARRPAVGFTRSFVATILSVNQLGT